MKQYRIHKNDLVEVLAGEFKGKKGTVLKVLRKKNRVLVEKINMGVRHTRPNPQMQQPGGIIEQEMPIHLSNVGLCCPHCLKTVRVGYRMVEEKAKDGAVITKKVRFCKKCNENLAQGGKKK